MSVKVVLTVQKGPDLGKLLEFEEKESLTIGRSEDCNFQIPCTEDTVAISRYHCLMEIVPPDVSVRDFGSLNGTFLNGREIGRRDSNMAAEEGWKLKQNEFDMKDGDVLDLCNKYQIAVSVYIPLYCAQCQCELPEEEQGRIKIDDELFLCNKCHEKNKLKPSPILPKRTRCIVCNQEMSKNSNPDEKICRSCMKNPALLLEHLFMNAKNGIGDAEEIAGFRKIKCLGKGGMGEVWQVEEESTGHIYALKLMLPKLAGSEKAKEQFLLEAYNAAQIIHPNIVRHYNSGYSDGAYFLLMEYCDAGSVDFLMKMHKGRLPLGLAIRIILQVLDGLDYAHKTRLEVKLKNGDIKNVNGLVHRDLSPQNIFLGGALDDPIAKVGDYGLAKAFETAGLTGRTRTGASAGKPVFMPRQQVINYKYSKPDVDVWAAAACLYFMLTGEFPKDFSTNADVFQVALKSRAIPIKKRSTAPEMPAKLAKVIDKALDDRGKLTFQSAGEFKWNIEKAL